MSTKHPNDGLTDAELAEQERQDRVQQHLGPLEDYTRPQDQVGSISRPLYISQAPSQTDWERRQDGELLRASAFSGRWQTYVADGGRLMIPSDYHHLLKKGGVITKGPGAHLLLFGSDHWQRMVRIIGQSLGLGYNEAAVARHVYGSAQIFKGLNPDGSITLSNDLIAYSNLFGDVVMAGVIYYAEIHDKQAWADAQLSPDEVRSIASALSQP